MKHPFLSGLVKSVLLALLLTALGLKITQYEWWIAIMCLNLLTVPQIWGYLES